MLEAKGGPIRDFFDHPHHVGFHPVLTVVRKISRESDPMSRPPRTFG